MTTTIINGRLSLTADSALRTKLRNKLDEYRVRFAGQVKDSSLPYKIGILEALFEKGFVDVVSLRVRFVGKLPAFNEADFNEALEIITAYNDNQTARLAGGTGLQ